MKKHARNGSPLALARIKSGLSQEQAAERLGVGGGKAVLSHYEVGRDLATPDLIANMAEVYEMQQYRVLEGAVATFRRGLTMTRYREMAKDSTERKLKRSY